MSHGGAKRLRRGMVRTLDFAPRPPAPAGLPRFVDRIGAAAFGLFFVPLVPSWFNPLPRPAAPADNPAADNHAPGAGGGGTRAFRRGATDVRHTLFPLRHG